MELAGRNCHRPVHGDVERVCEDVVGPPPHPTPTGSRGRDTDNPSEETVFLLPRWEHLARPFISYLFHDLNTLVGTKAHDRAFLRVAHLVHGVHQVGCFSLD